MCAHDRREMADILNKNFEETVMEDYSPLPSFEQRTNENLTRIDMVPGNIKYENAPDRLKKTEINKSCVNND